MNPLQKLTLILLLTGMAGVAIPLHGQSLLQDQIFYTLIPPLDFGGSGVECNSYLHWQKPQLPNGLTPPGLVGYYIYRDGLMIFYVNNGETLYWYDYNLEYGAYVYTITANYDLTSYGVPGQFGESPPAGPVTIFLNCDVAMPFYEPWNQGSFSYQSWQFIPAQGNWIVDVTQGNPLPTASFTGIPPVQDYEVTLKSVSLPGNPWICADMYLEFDYKLTDIASGGTEKLVAQYFVDNFWYPVVELKNEGSTGWVHQKIDISQVCGKRFRIGFKVMGFNSSNIAGWSIDNIRISPECEGPAGCGYSKSGNVVHLFWQPPGCDSIQVVAGYNIYRTNEYGFPPYIKLNTTPVVALEYYDTYPPNLTSAHYKYYITCLQKELISNTLLCEKSGDTLVVDYISGIPGKEASVGMQVFPNPASDHIRIASDLPVEWCELQNCMGKTVLSVPGRKRMDLTIPVVDLPAGIYLVIVRNDNRKSMSKISVKH